MTQAKTKPFDSFAAFQREKKENARLYQLLLRAKIMLETNADRLESRGVGVDHIRKFAKELAA